ncbi:drug resistance transporter, EmrB/QacA subfamily [Lentzea xinjiangensis]|uniref:Drug resistance transporter, EmrB/QacA subfamily n=1 Tax=Lentzea xinjiangensis TaxID=402600 RepID=A0A1H9EMH6_9PSEU|nr:MFS transporter [Lentzea xinjiangensis]SEQ26825.1 drug resistance transporter, EmrB/QacA subfamily [Lentzea xinjiangensis]
MIAWGTPRARWVLTTTILGSGMAMLDGTIVNVALPRIGAELNASVTDLQWILNGYLLALASLILVAGSLGDRFGRRRVYVAGVIWFGVASLLCGAAWNVPVLVAARVLQGVGAALLTPGALAILQASFNREDRSRAIGAWSGLSGVATAVGPLVGGLLVQAWSWRLAFLVNLPVAALCVYLALRFVPESRDDSAGHPNYLSALVGAVGLALLTGGLVEQSYLLAAAGLAAMIAFGLVQKRSADPLVPPELFGNRTFVVSNVLTFLVYAALGGVMVLLVLQLQISLGYSPTASGLASVPITIIMLLASSTSGKIAQRYGPRVQLVVGPVLVGVGMLLLRNAVPGASYVFGVLPGVLVFGVGLAIVVAPVTATVLASAPDHHAGVASGVNNAVARTGSLLAMAVLPAAVGLMGEDYANPAVMTDGWKTALVLCAVAAIIGGLLAVGVDNRVLDAAPEQHETPHPGECLHCGVEGPPTHVRSGGEKARQ